MKRYFVKTSSVVLSAILALSFPAASYASIKFKDIDENHWAYEYVVKVSDKGLMVGDTSGNFKPDNQIDKFQTSIIMARIMGYKHTGVTDTEAQYYQKVYDKNKGLLVLYHNAFEKWNKGSDREIAFLIEKEVLTPQDLDQFIIKSEDSQEKLRALSREESAMFLVKSLGYQDDALKGTYSFKFSDDDDINSKYKPYVYYLKEKGVFTPDKDNKFNPKNGITRAMMSTILTRADDIFSGGKVPEVIVKEDETPLGIPEKDNSTVADIFSVDGVVDKYFPSLNALQIVKGDGTKAIFKMAENNTIYIDGYLKTTDDLKQGMEVSLVVNSNEIVDVKGGTSKTNVGAVTTLSGTILDISVDENKLTIEVDLDGGSTEVREYVIPTDCNISSNGTSQSKNDLKIGDVIKANVTSHSVKAIEIDREDLDITGELFDKKYNAYGTPVISVRANSRDYDFTIDESCIITRKGIGEVSWNAMRIGDNLEIEASGNQITEIYAEGKKTSIEGIVENLSISVSSASITLKDSEGVSSTYSVIDGLSDIYSVKVGSKVRLKLDSREVESITILSEPASTKANVNGTITFNDSALFKVKDTEGKEHEISVDSSTVFWDSITGQYVDKKSVKNGRRVFVVFNSNSSNGAKTVTFLS